MTDSYDVKIISVEIGALSNAKRPIFKIPSDGGGITVIDANIVQAGAGTTGLNLVDLGTAGTAVAGTIASKGSAVYVANVPQAMTMVTPFVSGGRWVGVEEANVGAANAVTIVEVAYLQGK
jgi:hypothetical protein